MNTGLPIVPELPHFEFELSTFTLFSLPLSQSNVQSLNQHPSQPLQSRSRSRINPSLLFPQQQPAQQRSINTSFRVPYLYDHEFIYKLACSSTFQLNPVNQFLLAPNNYLYLYLYASASTRDLSISPSPSL